MRLQRCVQVAVGLVASSSVVIVLSGSALAASSRQDTVAQDVQTKTSSSATSSTAGVLPPVGPLDSSNGQNGTASSDHQGNAARQQDANVTPTGAGTTQVDNNNGSAAVQSGTAVPQSSANSGTSANASVVSSAAGKGDGNSGSVVSGGNSGGSGGQTQLAPPNNENISAASVPAEVAVVAPVMSVASVPLVPRTIVMPIQPVITNRVAGLAQDLAATVPTAPAPARAPAPTKSTGVLGALVVDLANVLVPQPLVPSADIAHRVMLPVSLLALAVLLVNVFFFTYGLWLRRGGFATAARSDGPSLEVTSSIATPLLLGYVTSPPDLRNPILMVAETKTRNQSVRNALRKEVMR